MMLYFSLAWLAWLACNPLNAAGPSGWMFNICQPCAAKKKNHYAVSTLHFAGVAINCAGLREGISSVLSLSQSLQERETSDRRNPIFRPEREAFHRCPAELEVRGGTGVGDNFWREKRE